MHANVFLDVVVADWLTMQPKRNKVLEMKSILAKSEVHMDERVPSSVSVSR